MIEAITILAESFSLQFAIWILVVHVVAACWVWVWSQSIETPHSLMEVCSGWFVLQLCFHTRQPWIFTACLSGDNNDCLRPSSCQMSVLWGFACLTRVTLIFDSSVASLLWGICCMPGTTCPLPPLRGRSLPDDGAAHKTQGWNHLSSGKHLSLHIFTCAVMYSVL